jgi:CO/xanthine dehydrogenase FAD-binding subunit
MSLYPSYARPTSLDQASQLLAGLASGTVIIAGGQEIMPHINHGALMPDVYVDIGGLKELRGISVGDGWLSIGALTVHRELQTDALVGAHAPLLAYAATLAGGGRQVHNRATLGGNIVAQHPLYDIIPSLLALGAEIEMARGGETRRTSVADMLRDTRHGLGSEAILVRVHVPVQPAASGWAYEKLKASGGAYGSANAAALVGLDGGKIAAARLVIGAVADRPIDAEGVVQSLLGQAFTPGLAAQLETRCAALVDEPLSDAQGQGAWRRAMAGVVARRAFTAAIARAGQL